MSTRTALVTGGTGFVGRHVVRHLLNAGWKVDSIVRPESDRSVLTVLDASVTLHEHAGSTESMLRILREVNPDVVFHLASLFLSEHQPKDIDQLIQSNLLFGAQLVEAMSQTSTTLMVNTGTSWQHYENRDYSPVNLYAATKKAYEDLLQYYVEARGLQVITLKLYDTYGPDDPRPKLVNLLRRVIAGNHPLTMSPGEQLIDLVHVDDVARAFLVATARLLSGAVANHERYAVSSGQALPLRQLIEKIQQICGRTFPIDWGGRPYRAREVMDLWQGLPLPGWQATTSLHSELAQILCGHPDK